MLTAAENTNESWTRAEFAQKTTAQTPGSMDLRVPTYGVFVPIFLFSVTGNTLVILTVVLLRKMKTVPMIFIANLAACDLTTTVSSIAFDLPEIELGYWPYGAVLCKIIYPLATFSTNAAALTLVAISIDRYVSIICPLNLQYRITKGKCFKIIAAIHFSSLIAVVPYIAILKHTVYSELPACEENWPDGYYLDKAYTVLLFVLQYGIPLVVMSVVYTRIGLKLCKSTGKAAELSSAHRTRSSTSSSGQTLLHSAVDKAAHSLQKRKRQNEKTAKMFLFVVVIFLIFMMPHQLLWLSYEYARHTEGFKQNQALIVFVCRAFTYANSVLNPIVYGVCNGNFRRGVLSVLKCQCSKARQRKQDREVELKRSETVMSTNNRQRQDSFRSRTSTLDSATAGDGLKENSTRSNGVSVRKEPITRNGNAVAHDGRKALKTNLGQESVSKPQNINFMARGETQENTILHDTKPSGDNILNGSSARPGTRNSLYDNELNSDLLHLASESDTLYWLRETETLLNKLCRELDVSRGEKSIQQGQQRDILLPKKEKNRLCTNLSVEKETIL